MNNEEKLIEKCKKFNYNFFWNKSKLWSALVFVLGLTPFYKVVDYDDRGSWMLYAICFFLAVGGFFIYDSINT